MKQTIFDKMKDENNVKSHYIKRASTVFDRLMSDFTKKNAKEQEKKIKQQEEEENL